MSVPNTPAAPSPQPVPPPMPTADSPASAPKKTNVLALVAMIVAIVGFIFACIPGALIVGWILLPIAFVLSIVSLFLKGDRKWMGVVGLIASIVGTIVGFVVFFAVIANAASEAFENSETSISQPTEEEAAPAAEEETTEASEDRHDLVLVETAFGRSGFDDSTWWYVAVFDNPNEDYVFSFAGIDVEALDAGGTILDSSSDYRTIFSGRTAVVGTFFSVGQGEIASLDVRGPEAAAATRAPKNTTGSFEITEVTPISDEWSTDVNGKVTSTFSEDQELVTVVVIARDASGAIIGAESGYIDRLPTGGTAQFEVTFFDPLPGDTTYEAYAAL